MGSEMCIRDRYIVAGDLSSLEYALKESENVVREKEVIYKTVIPVSYTHLTLPTTPYV
ncbi:hypothetical protein CDFC105_30681 [Clostridioides difficile]|nr:hypothetical protein CDFC105_30681 [Clostridioides difficile]